MPAAQLRARWRDGEITYGVAVRLGSTWATEVFAASGFDFVWLDYQHGFNGDAALVPLLQSMRGTAATPLVRVPINHPAVIGQFLDAGAEGVIVPAVETPEDAERAVGACHYDKLRSYGALRTTYLDGGRQRSILCVVMVETELGVSNVEKIAAVDGVDAIFLGPNDLSFSLGIDPDTRSTNELFTKSVQRIRSACSAAGIAYGASGSAKSLRDQGCQMISVGGDSLFIESAMATVLKDLC